MSVLIFIVVSYILLSLSLYFLFPKAGVDAVKGLIPGVNFLEWSKLIGKSPKSTLWLLFPIVNIFTFCGMAVDLARSFGLTSLKSAAAAVIYAPGLFGWMAKNDDIKYEGPILDKETEYKEALEAAIASKDSYQLKKLQSNNPFHKSIGREWVESIVFAVFAAAFIRMFLIEAYVIPTPSMEGSLNVGDYLFVSKAHYGIRTPQTVAMVPLLHNRVPFINKESYLEKPSLPYYRLPGIEKIENGKPIVFNWPVGDSVYLTSQRSYFVGQEKYQPEYLQSDPELALAVRNGDIITRPVDKKDHYIKRCIGVGGDSIQVINRQVYINGVAMENPDHLQFLYYVSFPPGLQVNAKRLDDWGIDFGDLLSRSTIGQGQGLYALDEKQLEQIKSLDPGVQVRLYEPDAQDNPNSSAKYFPHDPENYPGWTADNYGPIYIPEEGATVDINMSNISMFKRVIGVYEHNDLNIRDGKIYINDVESSTYTFKQNYYWAMGDNRHNSEDSRAWGFVPMDHIVGKPLFIWFSTKEGSIGNGINWDRIFKSATSKK